MLRVAADAPDALPVCAQTCNPCLPGYNFQVTEVVDQVGSVGKCMWCAPRAACPQRHAWSRDWPLGTCVLCALCWHACAWLLLPLCAWKLPPALQTSTISHDSGHSPHMIVLAPACAESAGYAAADLTPPTAQGRHESTRSADMPRPPCARSDPSSIAHCSWCTYTGICKGCVAPYALVNNTCAFPAGTSFDGTTCAVPRPFPLWPRTFLIALYLAALPLHLNHHFSAGACSARLMLRSASICIVCGAACSGKFACALAA